MTFLPEAVKLVDAAQLQYIMQHTTKVRVLKETPTRVTLHFITLNRKIPISRELFQARVERGEYEVVER